METEYVAQVLTLQNIMENNSEMEYIATERNLIPAFIKEIYTEIKRHHSRTDTHKIYYCNILVKKKSVDHLESLGYNLFRQFESEKTDEIFDGPTTNTPEEIGNGCKKFRAVVRLGYALHVSVYTNIVLSRTWRSFPVIMNTSEYFREPSYNTFFPPGSLNRLDNPTTGCILPVNNLHSRDLRSREDRPIWGSTKRLPTSLESSSSSSSSEGSLNLEDQTDWLDFQRVTSLASSLRYEIADVSGFEGLYNTDDEYSSGTSADESIQENETQLMDYSVRSGITKHDLIQNDCHTSVTEVSSLYNTYEYYHVLKHPPTDDHQNELKEDTRRKKLIFKEFPSRFKRQESFDCSSLRNGVTLSTHPQEPDKSLRHRNEYSRQESEHSEMSAILCRLQDSEGLVQSIEITTHAKVKGAKPVDLSLVWNRKYKHSEVHFAFKHIHPLHYKREYDRIRQSTLSVFDSLMSRQTTGRLSQRKVLEVVAEPHYTIYPPVDMEEIKRFKHSRNAAGLMDFEGQLKILLKSFRSLETHPLTLKK